MLAGYLYSALMVVCGFMWYNKIVEGGGNMSDLKLYTPEEVAKILKVTPRTVRGYLRKGELKGAKIGREWRVTEEQVREFLAKNTANTEGEG